MQGFYRLVKIELMSIRKRWMTTVLFSRENHLISPKVKEIKWLRESIDVYVSAHVGVRIDAEIGQKGSFPNENELSIIASKRDCNVLCKIETASGMSIAEV